MLTSYAHLLSISNITLTPHNHIQTTIAGGAYVSIPSYNPHKGLDTDGPTSYAPSNGTPSNNYGTVAATATSYANSLSGGNVASSNVGSGGTGENYDDVRAMLHSMMDNPSW